MNDASIGVKKSLRIYLGDNKFYVDVLANINCIELNQKPSGLPTINALGGPTCCTVWKTHVESLAVTFVQTIR